MHNGTPIERYERAMQQSLSADSPVALRRCIDLRVAAYHARKGRFVDARSVVDDIRREFGSRYSAQIFSHINYVEGIIEYFESGAEFAVDKLNRSAAISARYEARDELPSLVWAWLAACHRQRAKWAEMSCALKNSLEKLDDTFRESLERVCIVIADALHETCEYEHSRQWYDCARRNAIDIGDDSAVSALLYNRAAIRMFNTRLDSARGVSPDIEGCRVEMEASSARNYTEYVREDSMKWAFDMFWGQLHLIRGEFQAAASMLDRPGVADQLRGWPAVDAVRRGDLIWCDAALGRASPIELESSIQAARDKLLPRLSPSDAALVASSLTSAAELIQASVADDCRKLRDRYLALVEIERAKELSAIREVMDWIRTNRATWARLLPVFGQGSLDL